MSRLALLALIAAVSGCGGGSWATAVAVYDKDEGACRSAAVSQVNHDNAKRALDWFSSPVRRWGQISDAQQRCMLGKGHDQLRWCSGDELAQARQAGRVVVTASGVQCLTAPGQSPPRT